MSDHNCLNNSNVIDSRFLSSGNYIRRRRQCKICSKRFTTHELNLELILTETEQYDFKTSLLDLIDEFRVKVEKI